MTDTEAVHAALVKAVADGLAAQGDIDATLSAVHLVEDFRLAARAETPTLHIERQGKATQSSLTLPLAGDPPSPFADLEAENARLRKALRAIEVALTAVLDSDALDPDEFLSLDKMCRKAIGVDWPYLAGASK